MTDSFLYFFPRMGKKERGGYPILKVHLEGPCRFFFFPGRGHNYLLYLLMDSSSPPPGINNEWSSTYIFKNGEIPFSRYSCKTLP